VRICQITEQDTARMTNDTNIQTMAICKMFIDLVFVKIIELNDLQTHRCTLSSLTRNSQEMIKYEKW